MVSVENIQNSTIRIQIFIQYTTSIHSIYIGIIRCILNVKTKNITLGFLWLSLNLAVRRAEHYKYRRPLYHQNGSALIKNILFYFREIGSLAQESDGSMAITAYIPEQGCRI